MVAYNLTYRSQVTDSRRIKGFTLMELMIVVAIIGVLAAIAYPSYQSSVIKTKRTEMMTDMQNIASDIESQKLVKGNYSDIDTSSFTGNYPKSGSSLYTVTLSSPLTRDWTITATPITGTMVADDGVMTLGANGQKCRMVDSTNKCGFGKEWSE